ncbi:MAG TPA: outer membrane beta-barrel protein [Candidatus Acidoferrales bacterium]|nr:outer membrane beta-barrel protein [Candidatus Acidoferrales bacterium]
MSRRIPWLKLCLPSAAILIALLASPGSLRAQGLELSGGWAHVTGDFGLDGFDLGAAWWVAPKISLAAEYDGVYDTSRVGTFEFTSVGAIASKSHLQDFLIGPRFYFAHRNIGKYSLEPFGEVQFGVSHLKSTVQEGAEPSITNSDSAFSWMLGGGADYRLSSHWSARGNLDLLRTHLNSAAQSRLRLVLGIAYTFGTSQ